MYISIHAPRAGCDLGCFVVSGVHVENFNPRTPCGVRLTPIRLFTPVLGFQSTHPVRGATVAASLYFIRRSDFNPRTPCGVRRGVLHSRLSQSKFQSTHPVRGATTNNAVNPQLFVISIHAPRAGCDVTPLSLISKSWISIHAPRAGCDGKFDGFTRPNLRKRYKKVSVQPKKRAKKKIKEMLYSHSHIFGWISGAKVPEFPVR